MARGLGTETAQDIALCPWLQARAQAQPAAQQGPAARLTVRCEGVGRVRVAPGMLGRVVDNLLGNALRHAPGPIELVAQPEPASGEGAASGVRIGVLDRGPGIPADRLAIAFRPFQRLAAEGEPAAGSFGLGLAIVQQLCHANGWQVRLAGRAGGGLEAWVTVPAAP